MYTEHFKFTTQPFQLTPDPRFLFESNVHSRAIAHLKFGLQQSEGFIVVTGDVGAGKTTIIGHLLETLDRHKYVATTVVTTNLDSDNILQIIASGLNLPYEGRTKAAILIDIETFLRDCVRRKKRCLVFVDEAQNLSVGALEELRMLSNIHVAGIAPVQLFLLGQPQFRTIMASEDLRQLRQRVIASYHLGPLDVEDTKNYILHRLHRVGWEDNPHFTPDAFPKIYEFTEGVPRRINTLCSRILLYCYLEETNQIDASVVEAVATDLEREFDQVLDKGETADPLPEPEATQQRPFGKAQPAAPAPPAEAPAPASPTPQAPQTPEAPTAAPAEPAPHHDVQPTVQHDQAESYTQPPPPPAYGGTPNGHGHAAAQAQPAATATATQPQMAPAPEEPPAASPAQKTDRRWREVIDLIESTPVETLAALSPQADASLSERNEAALFTEIMGTDRSHNRIFKRLLLLILEEYLREQPGARM